MKVTLYCYLVSTLFSFFFILLQLFSCLIEHCTMSIPIKSASLASPCASMKNAGLYREDFQIPFTTADSLSLLRTCSFCSQMSYRPPPVNFLVMVRQRNRRHTYNISSSFTFKIMPISLWTALLLTTFPAVWIPFVTPLVLFPFRNGKDDVTVSPEYYCQPFPTVSDQLYPIHAKSIVMLHNCVTVEELSCEEQFPSKNKTLSVPHSDQCAHHIDVIRKRITHPSSTISIRMIINIQLLSCYIFKFHSTKWVTMKITYNLSFPSRYQMMWNKWCEIFQDCFLQYQSPQSALAVSVCRKNRTRPSFLPLYLSYIICYGYGCGTMTLAVNEIQV